MSFASTPRPLPFFDSKEFTPYWTGSAASRTFKPSVVPRFEVINQESKKVTEEAMSQHLSLVNFFFTSCPGICPTMTRSIEQFRKKLGPIASKVPVYSFSVEPEVDTPQKLKQYARNHGIDLGTWTLLTGNRKKIYELGREVFHADGSTGVEKKKDSFIHTPNIYLLDRERRIRGVYDTSDATAMQLLAADLLQLQND